ncbi:MAG: glutamate--tRNA ligase, partial [Candidatus Wolfebacteria bacterium]|nr:glutamate--tRNA ligase [Candidatus Wolfebacteria bacterium]
VHDREILSREELIKEFDLRRVQKAGAVFNLEKLDWLNSQYIKNTREEELLKQLRGFAPDAWLKEKDLMAKIIKLEKDRMRKLTDIQELADFFFELPEYPLELLYWPRPKPTEIKTEEDKNKLAANLKILTEEIEKIFKEDFTKEKLESAIMPLTEVWGRGELLWPLRVSLSGKPASPGPFDIMDILGKEETLNRLKIAVGKIQ